MAFCGNCGAEIEPGAKFCGGCGNPILVQTDSQLRPVPPPTIEPSSGAPVEEQRKTGLRYIILTIFIVIIALGVGYALFGKSFLSILYKDKVQDKQSKPQIATPSPPPSQQVSKFTPPPSQRIPKSVSPPPQEIPKSLPPPSQQKRVQSREYYEAEARVALQNKDFQKLRRILDEGLQYYPDSADLWSSEAGYFYSVKESGPESFRKERALKAAKKALELNPSEKYYFKLGLVYNFMFKDYSSALDCYERAENYASSFPTLYYFMARSYEELRFLNNAANYYDKFLKAAPNDQYAQDARNRLARLRH